MVKDEKTSEKVWSIYNRGKEREVLGGWEVAIMYYFLYPIISYPF
jgi:hypothetical protein